MTLFNVPAKGRVSWYCTRPILGNGPGSVGIQLASLDFTALKAKRVVDATPSGAGVFCDAMEEVGVSSLKVAKNFLLRSILDSANPVVFFVQHGQLTGLGQVVDGLPGTGLELPPVIAALLKCNVVNKATDASIPPPGDAL